MCGKVFTGLHSLVVGVFIIIKKTPIIITDRLIIIIKAVSHQINFVHCVYVAKSVKLWLLSQGITL